MANKTNNLKSKTKEAKQGYDRKRHYTIIAVGIAAFLLVVNLITGVVSYGIMTIVCLHPPITGSKFAASYHYFRPGEPFYGPGAFKSYYCSEQAARSAGLQPGYEK